MCPEDSLPPPSRVHAASEGPPLNEPCHGPWHVLEVTGALFGVVAARMARSQTALVSSAVLAQTADLVLFAFINPEGERNPHAHVLHEIFLSAVGDLPFGLTTWMAVVVMLSLKLGLIAYLVWAAPVLGRYRLPVLAVATVAGIVGAAANLFATPPFSA